MRLKTHNIASGFSLIEVMVATVLLGLMGALLMTSINSSVNAKDMVEKTSLGYQLANQAVARMTREIALAYLSKNINLSDPIYVTQFKGKKDRLFFSAFGHVVRQKDAKQSDEQVLGFYIGTDKSGKTSLMRRFSANLNKDVEKGGTAQVLCPDVATLEFSYYDNKQNKWAESWLADPLQSLGAGLDLANADNKDAGANSHKGLRLPSFVKISLTVEINGVAKTFIGEAEIPIEESLDLN